MHRLGIAALLLVVAGCGREVKQPLQELLPVVPIEVEPSTTPEAAAPRCRKVDTAWLRQHRVEEGSILHVFEISRARRSTIEQLNTQIGKLAAALRLGCLEGP